MALLHFDNVGIAALAGVLPDHVQKINTDPRHPNAAYIANFVKQTGIKQRHISITEQTSTDLGYAALLAALNRAGWEAQSLDALVFMSQTPDFNPSTGNAHVLHNHMKLGPDVLAFDITLGCSSFPYGLSVCASLLQQPHINRVAMISGDTVWLQYPSKEALMLAETFLTGEGSTALLLEKGGSAPLDISLHSDGSGYHFLYHPWGGARNSWRHTKGIMPNGVVYEGGGGYMDGMEITSFATLRVVDDIQKFANKIDKQLTEFDGIILHQANMQIIKTITRRLKIPADKVPTTVGQLANTNGASVSLTIVDAYAGMQKHSLKLLVSAFGVGLSWGIVRLSLDPDVIAPMQTYSGIFEEDFLTPIQE